MTMTLLQAEKKFNESFHGAIMKRSVGAAWLYFNRQPEEKNYDQGGKSILPLKTVFREYFRKEFPDLEEVEVWAVPKKSDVERKAEWGYQLKSLKDEDFFKKRCCGYQNRRSLHEGKPLFFSGVRDFDFQNNLVKTVKDFLDGQSSRGVFVYGRPGVGKTYVFKALHNEMINRRVNSCFIKTIHLLTALKSDFDQIAKNLMDFQKVEVLILDDFGAEKLTEFVQEKFYEILDFRYENRYPTFISSNQGLAQVDRENSRLASRLNDSSWMDTILVQTDVDIRSIN